ncbi:MAG: prepilin-type N-terminal cleavage/methylation domain-containing protein [Candidatus Omnitrophica bacterium]|jgi:hypothetical protein|nr:prepilin-type N-terminal cleavage/methylation domain-containing protein [Candidatus Omnitrophota bacterium]MDD5080580.1 prepilin-type N-terminal cleavage/methylation domain-containing protein [Candidatus Omnitrophota bacterium]
MIKRRALSLIEFLITMVIMTFVFAGLIVVFSFLFKNIVYNFERSDMYGQVTYALDDMRLRFISAIETKTMFSSSNNEVDFFEFKGEKDIYNIRPNDATLYSATGSGSKVWYRYSLKDDGNLVLEVSFDDGNTYQVSDVLVDKRYRPRLSFVYVEGDEPNFFEADIKVVGEKNSALEMDLTEGIQTWFIGVVK